MPPSCHLFIHPALREMITQTWKWAKENKKIIISPIHGGESVSLPVEIFAKRTRTQTQSLTLQAHGEVEDPGCMQAYSVGTYV